MPLTNCETLPTQQSIDDAIFESYWTYFVTFFPGIPVDVAEPFKTYTKDKYDAILANVPYKYHTVVGAPFLAFISKGMTYLFINGNVGAYTFDFFNVVLDVYAAFIGQAGCCEKNIGLISKLFEGFFYSFFLPGSDDEPIDPVFLEALIASQKYTYLAAAKLVGNPIGITSTLDSVGAYNECYNKHHCC